MGAASERPTGSPPLKWAAGRGVDPGLQGQDLPLGIRGSVTSARRGWQDGERGGGRPWGRGLPGQAFGAPPTCGRAGAAPEGLPSLPAAGASLRGLWAGAGQPLAPRAGGPLGVGSSAEEEGPSSLVPGLFAEGFPARPGPAGAGATAESLALTPDSVGSAGGEGLGQLKAFLAT